MKHRFLVLTCACLLTAAPALHAETIAPQGQDDRIEWQVMSHWQLDATPVDIVRSLDGKLVFILDNQHRILVYDYQGQLQGKIPVSEGVTRIDIAPQGEALFLIDEKSNSFTSVSLSFIQNIDITGSPFKGNADSSVIVTVFTDFECPYCRKLEPLLNQVFEQNKEKIKLVFKNMPLNFHKMADPSHRAAMAADMQGKFWEYHDRIFAAPALTPELLDTTATELGLNMEKFNKDRNSPAVRQQIRKDLGDAQQAGVTGTPTIFINGRRLTERSMQGFQHLIDQELAKAGK